MPALKQVNTLWRSLFFAPANRHDLLAKFGRIAADNYVIDLEDGTPVGQKDSARENLRLAVTVARGDGLQGRLLVRINPWSGLLGMSDLKAVLECDVDGIVLPKLERADELAQIDLESDRAGRSLIIVGGIESMMGVLDVRACVNGSKCLKAVYFGAEDYSTEIGGRRTLDGVEVMYARQRVLLAAKAAGIAAIDQAVTDIYNAQVFERDALPGRNLGYDGKICLNPKQVGLANRIFSPSADEILHARRLIAAVKAAPKSGVLSFEGQMVDAPLIKRAERIVEQAMFMDSSHE